MIPDYIERKHILEALARLRRGQPVPRRRKSRSYFLLHGGKRYPPKYAVSLAHTFASPSKDEWPFDRFGGGTETNNFLLARGFRVVGRNSREVIIEPIDENEESTFPEGRELYRLHRGLERDSRIARRAKRKRIQERGDLGCDVCGFSFKKTYGPRGVGYIEAHHRVPVSQLRGRRKTRLTDIALVCSNCHRMLHRRPWIEIDQLREIVMGKR